MGRQIMEVRKSPAIPSTSWFAIAWDQSTNALLAVTASSCGVLAANPSAAMLWGHAQADLSRKNLVDLMEAQSVERFRELAMAKGERPFSMSGVSILPADGGSREVDLRVTHAADGGEPIYLCQFTDTSKPDVATELRRRNWALSAYARSSSALIRAGQLDELTARVCEAIVEESVYVIAAVGLVRAVEGRPVEIVAKAGPAISYLDGLEISGSIDARSGMGPTGRAIRGGLPYVMTDSLTDPAYAPWRERGLSFGIGSSVTVPFEKGGEVIGVLLVYAAEPNAFGSREMDLFCQLADELGFAAGLEEERRRMKLAEATRRRAEQGLRAERDFSNALINSLPGILYLYDREGNFIRWNEKFRRVSGYTDDEIAAMRPTDFFAIAERDLVRSRIEEVFESGESYVEAGFMSKTGQITPYYLTGVVAPVGGRECLVGVGIDLTERRRAEAARLAAEDAARDAKAELARLDRVTILGEMTATLAHEINQPLAAIVTNSDAALRWLARDPPNLDEGRNAIDRIRRDSSRANDLIKRMRLATQKHAPSFAMLDLNRALEEVLAYVRPDQRRLDFLIQTDLSKTLPPVLGDWVQLQQVILNLVLNGMEAMRSVTSRPRVLRISSRLVDDGAVLVAVEDNGVGLDPATADRIFDSLFTTREGGTGLGLSVSRSIVEAHGGRLWVENASPHGAIFQFTIPAAPEEAP